MKFALISLNSLEEHLVGHFKELEMVYYEGSYIHPDDKIADGVHNQWVRFVGQAHLFDTFDEAMEFKTEMFPWNGIEVITVNDENNFLLSNSLAKYNRWRNYPTNELVVKNEDLHDLSKTFRRVTPQEYIEYKKGLTTR